MRDFSKILRNSVIVIFLFIHTGCETISRNSEVSIIDGENVDSLKVDELKSDFIDMIEYIYTNQGRHVDTNTVMLSDLNGNKVSFHSYVTDHIIYVYFTPLACWDCIKAVCGTALNCDNGDKLHFIIPDQLRDAAGKILSDAGIPTDRLYYLHGSLGLPVEGDNKVFFFTLSRDDRSSGDVAINDVFVPGTYSGAVETYMDVLNVRFQ